MSEKELKFRPKFKFGHEVKFKNPVFYGRDNVGTVIAIKGLGDSMISAVDGARVYQNYAYILLMQEFESPLENFLHAFLASWFDEDLLKLSEEK